MLVSVSGARLPTEGELSGITLIPERVTWSTSSGLYGSKLNELELDKIELDNLGKLRAEPRRFARNYSLCSSADEVENELAHAGNVVEDLSFGASSLVICEGSPPERNQDREALLQAAARLQSRRTKITIVLGSGWARSQASASGSKLDCESLQNRFISDLHGEVQKSPICGFIGELDIEDETDIDTVITAAALAQKAIGERKGNCYPPIIVNVSSLAQGMVETLGNDVNAYLGSLPVFEHVFSACLQIVATFNDAFQPAPVDNPQKPRLLLVGLLEALPRPYIGLEAFSDGITQIMEKLLVFDFLSIGASTSSELGVDIMAAAISRFYREGVCDRVCVRSGTCFKIHLSKQGGDGYVHGLARLQVCLARAGVPRESILGICGGNIIDALSWYIPPEPPKPKARPRWKCDGPCGKDYSAKREPFTRLDYRYCSMECLRAHQRELEGEKTKTNDDQRRGGGGRRGVGNVGSWGVAVGSS